MKTEIAPREHLEKAGKNGIRMTQWVGGVTVGFSPVLYLIVILILHYQAGFHGVLPEVIQQFRNSLLLFFISVSVLCFPLACLVQLILARRARARTKDPATLATGLAAVGIVSLTIVHLPAVSGIVYYILTGSLMMGVLFQVMAVILYFPVQLLVIRQIQNVSDRQ